MARTERVICRSIGRQPEPMEVRQYRQPERRARREKFKPEWTEIALQAPNPAGPVSGSGRTPPAVLELSGRALAVAISRATREPGISYACPRAPHRSDATATPGAGREGLPEGPLERGQAGGREAPATVPARLRLQPLAPACRRRRALVTSASSARAPGLSKDGGLSTEPLVETRRS